MNDDPVVRSIHHPDRTTTFLDGSVRVVVELAGVAVGHGVYRSGWQWSRHVGPLTGLTSQPHVGYVLSGRMAVRGRVGIEVEAGPNEAFEAGTGHDAWVIGDEPCIALDWSPNDDR
ncbi:MAG TPA: hypothetical protein VES01_08880 [Dermatophilaceae bacterium]|nr:hypothetical protein [Dermatophilaceae bacterium]